MSDFDGGPRWPGTPTPGMYAVDIATGKLRWSTPAKDLCGGREFCQPGLSAAMDGHLRAYRASNAAVVWDSDTTRRFDTVNGITADGGSLGGGTRPVFKGSSLYVNSGYGIYFHMPGNVLLAFELDER